MDTEFITTPDGESGLAERMHARLDSTTPETEVVVRGRPLEPPLSIPKIPEECFTPPPTVSDEDHVLFDTEQVNAGGLYAQFFQNSALTNTGGHKVFGRDTNMIQSGYMTDGCEKDMREMRLLSDDLPPDTEFALQFMIGSSPWIIRRVKLGERISLETCGLPVEDAGKIKVAEAKPLTLVGGENFACHVRMIGGAPFTNHDKVLNEALHLLLNELGANPALKNVREALATARSNRVFRLRIEVRGAYRRPAYESTDYMAWRNKRALANIKSYGEGRGKVGHGLFDIDFMRNGTVRLFAHTRMNANGKGKEFGVDYNLVGNGGSLPRGWTKQVNSIELETKIEGALEIRILLSGHEWLKASVEEGGGDIRSFTLPETLTLIEGEHFVLEVRSLSTDALLGTNEVRATLHGPLFT